jgi:3-phenylpropionate/cinnamic acid dioxygenase small subunit
MAEAFTLTHRPIAVSRTRRFISYGCIAGVEGDEILVTASFLVYRFRAGQGDPYVGRYLYTLERRDRALKIRHRRAALDLKALSKSEVVSMIF